MKKLIIDRFEGIYAICELEDKSTVSLSKYILPPDCQEGDILVLEADGRYRKDMDATTCVEKRICEKMNRLFER